MDRRTLLRGTLAAGPILLGLASVSNVAAQQASSALQEMTIAEMQAAMEAGTLTARGLLEGYLARIAALNPQVNAIIEVNPDARQIADQLDLERATQGPRGPLHGIPILLKDNIDTADRMNTAAGSLALVGAPVSQDATAARRLRDAGAV